MNKANKEFWDLLFLLHISQSQSTKADFRISIAANEVIDGQIFKVSNFRIPEYYSYEITSFTEFFINSQVQVINTY